jgi:hypothetical protein
MGAEFDREKFKDAMHYVIAKAGGHRGFGATKLYKVLWFSDARTFMVTGEPITGAEYIREKYGPVPRLAMPMREEMAREGRVKIWMDNGQWRFKALLGPSMGRFSASERQTLDWWIKHIDEDHTAESISDESHDYAWEIAKMGEVLPYHAFLASRWRDPTDDELADAKRRLGSLGL